MEEEEVVVVVVVMVVVEEEEEEKEVEEVEEEEARVDSRSLSNAHGKAYRSTYSIGSCVRNHEK